MKNDKVKFVMGFKSHGVQINGAIGGNQRYGDCPFCDKEDKFYFNEENGLWDCKVCGRKGNYPQFLKNISELNCSQISPEQIKELAKDRGIPSSAFNNIELGISLNNKYTFPIKNNENKLVDLRTYKLNQRLMGSPTCKTGLWNAQNIQNTKGPIYVCEGEWDGIAMSWLLRKLKKTGIVVAVPGANTFKKEWISWFNEREVICLYDHDEAGENGQRVLLERLQGVSKPIQFLHWPDSLPQGYDLKDLISTVAIKSKKPKACWNRIQTMLMSGPVPKTAEEAKKLSSIETEKKKLPKIRTVEQVYSTIQKWLYLKDMSGVEMAMACVISNKLQGDPLWLFLVAPPGGAKTEILSTLTKCDDSYFTSSLTPHALISGASWTNGVDPSLIPKLDGKVLMIKDFTTILAKRDQEKDEIFGILRDAYDGSCGKVFGTGTQKHYESRFTILSAVTPKVYEMGEIHQSLGERFLKFCIGNNLTHVSETEIIDRAINNLSKEKTMRNEMSDCVAGFMSYKFKQIEDGKIPTIPSTIKGKIIALAQYGARMRGIVSRDKYRPEIVTAVPSTEVGSRLGKQLAKLAISLAIVNGRSEVNEHDYIQVKKTMLDTISQRIERMVRVMYIALPYFGKTIKTRKISEGTRFSQTTCARLLGDLDLLEIVDRKGHANKYEWDLSKYIRNLIYRADLYKTPEELYRNSLAPSLNGDGKKVIKVKRVKRKVKRRK